MGAPDPRDFSETLIAFGSRRLTEHLVELGVRWAGAHGVPPNGLKLSRSDRIMQFLADYESGLLEQMALVAPQALSSTVAQFRRDMRRVAPELVERPTPASSRSFAPHAAGLA